LEYTYVKNRDTYYGSYKKDLEEKLNIKMFNNGWKIEIIKTNSGIQKRYFVGRVISSSTRSKLSPQFCSLTIASCNTSDPSGCNDRTGPRCLGAFHIFALNLFLLRSLINLFVILTKRQTTRYDACHSFQLCGLAVAF